MISDEDIRKIVREEVSNMSKKNASISSSPSIYERTQTLIRQSVQSTQSHFENNSSPSASPAVTSGTKRKSMPGHPWRLQPKPMKGKAKKPKSLVQKQVYVWLLQEPFDEEIIDEDGSYGFS